MNKFNLLLKRGIWDVKMTFKPLDSDIDEVNCIAIEPVEQRYLVSGGMHGKIALYDTITPQSLYSNRDIPPLYISSHRNNRATTITGVSWCPYDSRILSSCTISGELKIWDVSMMSNSSSDPIAFTFDTKHPILCQMFMKSSGCHGLIATGLSTTDIRGPLIRLCDLRSGSQTQSLYSHWINSDQERVNSIHCIMESIDPYSLVFGCSDGSIRSWDIRRQFSQYSNPTNTLLKGNCEVISVCLAEDRSSYYYCTANGTLSSISLLSTSRTLHNNIIPLQPRFDQSVSSGVLCSLFESYAAIADLNTILLVNMSDIYSDPVVMKLEQHWDQVSCLQWSEQSMVNNINSLLQVY